MKNQIAISSQNNLNTNKKLDELNTLLMSHVETDSKCTQNLANLRDVLKAAHQINNTQLKNNPEDNLNLLIELLKLDYKDTNNRQISLQQQQRIEPEAIINRIENDLQESFKLLKQYNDKLDEHKSNEKMDDFFYQTKHSNCKYYKMTNDVNDNVELINDEDEETNVYNFNRNDIIRKNFFGKNENLSEKLKKLSQLNKKNSISETSKLLDTPSPVTTRHPVVGIKKPMINNLRRNSLDQSSFTENQRPQTLTKSSTAQFDYEKLHNLGNKNECVQLSESGFWNYDELNELKQKFISLLGESNAVQDLKHEQPKDNLDVCCMVENPPNRFSSMSFVALENRPISSSEQLKIESFYRSFGTSLFISQSCASLYTVQNSKIRPQLNDMNRISIATTQSIKFNSELHKQFLPNEINHEILKDLMNNRHQDYVPVYHRGVPLWLFNSGKNPHRPLRQLKFTLAEKGTGFILWQDRIDSNSDFNLYLMKKNDSSIHNVSSYFDNLSLINEIKQEQVESMLMTFKASDKKTTVFMKFDINLETIKFYEFYKRLIKNVSFDAKQRTKSLPIGVGNSSSMNKMKRNSQNRTNVSFYNYDYNLLDSNSSPNKNKQKRQSCQIVPDNPEKVKLKRITKSDISNPCNYKHLISLKSTDKNSYYTLSKLLPNSVCLQNSNVSSPNSIGEKSLTSPSYSISSSTSFPTSSSSSPITPSSNLMSSEFLIQESSRSSFNQDSLNDHSTSSLSNSSLSNILPPILNVNNTNKFFELSSYNHKLAKQRTVK